MKFIGANGRYALPITFDEVSEIVRAIECLASAELSKFDPNQPRVAAGSSDGGRWTSTGTDTGSSGQKATRLAAARISPAKEAECEAQYASDKFHCQMVGLPGCYAQAMLRYANCLQGLPIPPLNY